MAISKDLLEILVCPLRKKTVELKPDQSGLKCVACHRVYPIRDDIPVMLVDEARLASAIDHPNVVKVRELGFDNGVPFIVMDYIEGVSLAELRRELSGMGRALDVSIFVQNGPSTAGLGSGGEGYLSFSIATPTGEGVTTPLTFTRQRRSTTAAGGMRVL